MKSLFGFQELNFRVITLREPPKDILAVYLDAEHQGDEALTLPQRCARVEVLLKTSSERNDLVELIVDLDTESIISQHYLEGKHSYIDAAYMKEVEEACKSDPRVQDEINKLQLPDGAAVIVEPWAYATDGSNDMSRRITMVRSSPSPISSPTLIHTSAGSTLTSPPTLTRITTPTRLISAPRFLSPST